MRLLPSNENRRRNFRSSRARRQRSGPSTIAWRIWPSVAGSGRHSPTARKHSFGGDVDVETRGVDVAALFVPELDADVRLVRRRRP